MDEKDVRVLGVCAECSNDITDDVEDYYCDEDGNYFCCVDCAMIYYHIHRLEI
jgi:hypothetical protein